MNAPVVYDLYGKLMVAVDKLGRQRRDEHFMEYGRRVRDALAPIIMLYAQQVQAAVLDAVEQECRDYRWRNRREHGYADAKPCGYCGACKAVRVIRAAQEETND